MSRQFVLMCFLALGSQIASATTMMNCFDGRGRELSVRMNGVETVTPFYDVVFKMNGKVLERFEVRQIEDSRTQFKTDAEPDRNGVVKSVGYVHPVKKGIYQHLADGGRRPLPPLMFDQCILR